MIQTLSSRFSKPVAGSLLLVFYLQLLASVAYGNGAGSAKGGHYGRWAPSSNQNENTGRSMASVQKHGPSKPTTLVKAPMIAYNSGYSAKRFKRMGGPSAPEATSFKPVGSDNLVNLFTGNFSYSIPLLDVGGYPVNLFYNGGISMEQEASWVGLGWNINPGSVSRNMRGVPDDFDGTDTLVQTQNVKPNKTWGGNVGVDGEVLGIKEPNLNFDLGFSYNNYLGPALDLGAGISVSIPLIESVKHEKGAPPDTSNLSSSLSLGLSAKLSSRSGLTISPSLNVGLSLVNEKTSLGIGLSTSYNSRTGIKDLNISSQTSMYSQKTHDKGWLDKQTTYFSHSAGLTSSTISFARPSYMPTLRMPMQYSNYSGQLEVGAGMFGLRGAASLKGYYSVSKVADGSMIVSKPLVGFMYMEKAIGHKDAVMDFNRLNDGEVTPHTPIISAPQYDYDIFSIQGEGTGGSIRAYRGNLGFVRDNETTSKDNNISIGFDIAPAGHYGGNWDVVSTPTRSGGWDDANNRLNQALLFTGPHSNSGFENLYFRNPGEATVTNDDMIQKVGRDNLVRFRLDGSAVSPKLEPQLEQFGKNNGAALGTVSLSNTNVSPQRDKRTQVITMQTASDASRIGLETAIRNYLPSIGAGNNLQYNSIPRVGGYRKGHHISEVDVLEGSGMRYVYGLPVYSTAQKDFTFSVTRTGDASNNLVPFDPNEPTTSSPSITGGNGIDGYVNIQQTPAYASSFLITGLLSPDYVDVTGDGITEDDMGSAVKFNYSMSASTHKWRTPRYNANGNTAHFNVGLKTEKRDNKASISYGEREAWYMHSIESKSMIAVFKTGPRKDAKGVISDLDGSINTTENANLELDSIMLFTKADIKANGLAGAVPLKTVHFDYSYALCNGTPDNSANGGKLTLKDIYFTFNGQARASKNMYVFNYGNTGSDFDNPRYSYNASDRWGTYKPMKDSAGNAVNPCGLDNIDYPYTAMNKAMDDQYAGAWSLKKILLPSGGQMEVQYEADDYAYVQDRRASNMFNIYGLGMGTTYTQSPMLFFGSNDQNYVYVRLPTALQGTDPAKLKQEIYSKYLDGTDQLAFKLNIRMPKGMEPLTVYANYDDYGICPNSTDNRTIYIKLRPVAGKGPLANAAIQFLINNLPGQAFPGYDMSENTALTDFLYLIPIELGNLIKVFTNADGQARGLGGWGYISPATSFLRLNSPSLVKYGGGHRVKRVLVKDNWDRMTRSYLSKYGQDYDYTTSQMVNGTATTISSGVASYEPGIGSEENPFRGILQFQDKLPAASAQFGAIEMPMLEGLYPAPVVGYSRVTVRSINRTGMFGDSVVRSSIGKQVTEFYTAKDYPTFSAYTPMANMDYHHNPPFSLFYKEMIDRRTTSQGFLVVTNDMHGKMRSQAAYSEGDPNTPLSYTLHRYRNTGANGLDDKVDFVHNDQGGTVTAGNMGVDMELMTDVREFKVTGNDYNGQIQTDFFTFVPFPIFLIPFLSPQTYTENTYRAVTTTKLINYHAIEDSVIVNDKGSTVTTKTTAYDAETGSAIVTQTANEFNDPIYNVSYPAYWAYSGVGPAYANIGRQFDNVNFSDGKIISGVSDPSIFESGDELYVTTQGTAPTCPAGSGSVNRIWAFDTIKNSTALTMVPANRNMVFMDSAGNPFTKTGVSFRIARSGHRNDLGLTVGSTTAMENPVRTTGNTRKLVLDNTTTTVVAASAVAYKEKWQTDGDVILPTIIDACTSIESVDCKNGVLPKHLNPYLKGLVGNYKPYRSYTYYGSRKEIDPAINTTIRKNGYINGFANYWNFDGNSNMVPDNNNANWVWNSELTKVNSKGQELETMDALYRYTSAQYGYSKNLPVAMVQNARNGESFEDGFEDYAYAETINSKANSQVACDNKKYINFNGLGGSIVNTDYIITKAHSGKYMLQIDKKSLITKPLDINTDVTDYSLLLQPGAPKVLSDVGGNITNKYIYPTYSPLSGPPHLQGSAYLTPTFVTGGGFQSTMGSGSWLYDTLIATPGGYSGYQINTQQYTQVDVCRFYKFNLTVNHGNINACDNSASLHVTISDQNGNTIKEFQCGDFYVNIAPNAATSQYFRSITDSCFLPKGIYSIQADIQFYHYECSGNNPSQYGFDSYYSLSTDIPSNTYQTLSTVNGCVSTNPIPATDSMLNPTFALVPGKKMQFSAWVREDCAGAVPCQKTDYSNSNIDVLNNGTSIGNLKRTGTIIEGWQKVEGDFTLPIGATNASLVFNNSNNAPMYVDDVRIHPFNANMKSYVYDPRTLRLSAELDENNYASFYEYDAEGQLVRVKKETIQGIKTIQETRSAKQKGITDVQ